MYVEMRGQQEQPPAVPQTAPEDMFYSHLLCLHCFPKALLVPHHPKPPYPSQDCDRGWLLFVYLFIYFCVCFLNLIGSFLTSIHVITNL